MLSELNYNQSGNCVLNYSEKGRTGRDLLEEIIGDPVVVTEGNPIVDVDLSSDRVDVDWPL